MKSRLRSLSLWTAGALTMLGLAAGSPSVEALSGPAHAAATPSEDTLPDDATLLNRLRFWIFGPRSAVDFEAMLTIPTEDLLSCMQEAGFPQVEAPQVDNPRFELSAEEYASRYGLGITASYFADSALGGPGPFMEYWASLSSAEQTAYNAAEADCVGQDIDIDEYNRFVAAESVAVGLFRPVVDSDDRVEAALEAWRACMAAAGYELSSPVEMINGFFSRAEESSDLDALLAEEIQVAVANVPCIKSYDESRGDVVASRFGEYRELLLTAYQSGSGDDGVG